MPIYDYQCSNCHHRFELRQGFDAKAVQECPSCQGRALRRFHPVGVIYKGSGFYTTDYKRNGSSVSSSREDSGKETKPGDAKVESKAKAPVEDSKAKAPAAS